MRALLLIDIQNDFLPGGALAVSEGDQVVPVANRLLAMKEHWTTVAMTQDWHPPEHQSFAAQHPGRSPGEVVDLHGLTQVLWPVHCVQGTPGAAFAPGLETASVAHISQKGLDPEVDSYSGFFDNGRRHATDLDAFLRERGVAELYVCGLATDYCVKWTVLDAISLGYSTHLVTDGCRGVGLDPGDVPKAIAEMRAAGAKLVTSAGLGVA